MVEAGLGTEFVRTFAAMLSEFKADTGGRLGRTKWPKVRRMVLTSGRGAIEGRGRRKLAGTWH